MLPTDPQSFQFLPAERKRKGAAQRERPLLETRLVLFSDPWSSQSREFVSPGIASSSPE